MLHSIRGYQIPFYAAIALFFGFSLLIAIVTPIPPSTLMPEISFVDYAAVVYVVTGAGLLYALAVVIIVEDWRDRGNGDIHWLVGFRVYQVQIDPADNGANAQDLTEADNWRLDTAKRAGNLRILVWEVSCLWRCRCH